MSPTPELSDQLETAVLDREAGYALLNVLQDMTTQQATFPGLETTAPGFADWVVTALFGGTYQRPGLGLRDRQIAILAALTALGGVEPQLNGHVRTSLRVGMTREEVVEVFVHLAPYVGVPKALAGLRVARAALAALDVEDAEGAEDTKDAETSVSIESAESAGDAAGPRAAVGAESAESAEAGAGTGSTERAA